MKQYPVQVTMPQEKQHQDNNIIMYPVGTCSIVGGSVLSGIDERRFSNNARLNKV